MYKKGFWGKITGWILGIFALFVLISLYQGWFTNLDITQNQLLGGILPQQTKDLKEQFTSLDSNVEKNVKSFFDQIKNIKGDNCMTKLNTFDIGDNTLSFTQNEESIVMQLKSEDGYRHLYDVIDNAKLCAVHGYNDENFQASKKFYMDFFYEQLKNKKQYFVSDYPKYNVEGKAYRYVDSITIQNDAFTINENDISAVNFGLFYANDNSPCFIPIKLGDLYCDGEDVLDDDCFRDFMDFSKIKRCGENV